MVFRILPISSLERSSSDTVALVSSAVSTAVRATLAAALALRAISPIDWFMPSVLSVTVRIEPETFEAASATT